MTRYSLLVDCTQMADVLSELINLTINSLSENSADCTQMIMTRNNIQQRKLETLKNGLGLEIFKGPWDLLMCTSLKANGTKFDLIHFI